ncbi:MAG: methyltransferase domain-containing protein [Desulfuromonadaceae bacterium]|nr:methyltransferase domain-containing protein [Desulfuromonadaceae bacterium]
MNTIRKMLLLTLITHLIIYIWFSNTASAERNDNFYSSVPSAYMDDPRRNEWQNPDKVMEYLLIKPGNSIADIGAGTGFFTIRFARKVGKKGVIYASDIDRTMVNSIEKRAKKENLENIVTIHSKAEDPLIPKSSVDLVFICDTYLFIENRVDYLIRLKQSLKNSGRLAIISFNSKAEISGAPPPQRMIPKDLVISEALKAGFVLEADFFFIPSQDFLLFTKI